MRVEAVEATILLTTDKSWRLLDFLLDYAMWSTY